MSTIVLTCLQSSLTLLLPKTWLSRGQIIYKWRKGWSSQLQEWACTATVLSMTRLLSSRSTSRLPMVAPKTRSQSFSGNSKIWDWELPWFHQIELGRQVQVKRRHLGVTLKASCKHRSEWHLHLLVQSQRHAIIKRLCLHLNLTSQAAVCVQALLRERQVAQQITSQKDAFKKLATAPSKQ